MADAVDIMSYFPLATPRRSQELVIREIEKAFDSGKRIVLLEGPVGSGKSAIAITFARKYKNSHLITPRKALQDQYYQDFSKDVVLMKGRSSYPCTFHSSQKQYNTVIKSIKEGRVRAPRYGEPNCSDAPCRNDLEVYNACVAKNGPCPYNVAMDLAQSSSSVVHNLHSFIFQTNYSGKFQKRDLLIIDEAHEIEDILRDFVSRKIAINKPVPIDDIPHFESLSEWCDYFLNPDFVPKESEFDINKKKEDPEYESETDRYIERIESLRSQEQYCDKAFTMKLEARYQLHRQTGVIFEFTPHSLGNAAENYLFSYGEKVLLMSGTLYSKEQYCKYLGINKDDAYFIRVPSTFPLSNRPIYLKSKFQVDTSHRAWNDNLDELADKIKEIMTIFKDVKGVIHAPSYDAMEQIVVRVADARLMTHGRFDFQEKLNAFFEANDNSVFVSPICQQGIDFKGDRARFQMVLRIPYLSVGDKFVEDMARGDFSWYNYKALVTFGQEIGRVNRSESDFGATFLMDSRFNKFIAKNSKKLPKWLKDAIIT